MTETAILAEPSSVRPADILMSLIASLLAPMFLTASDGDIDYARMAAIETVSQYRSRCALDLIAIAQIVACGLTALGSLSLSLADDLSLPMTLRLRGNAVALNRAAEQNRRALRETHSGPAEPATRCAPRSGQDNDDEVAAPDLPAVAPDRPVEVTGRQPQAAERPAAAVPPAPPRPAASPPPLRPAPASSPVRSAPAPSSISPAPAPPLLSPAPAPRPAITREAWHSMLASSMNNVAAEFTTDLMNLPPAERPLESCRAAALRSCANHLIAQHHQGEPHPTDKVTR